MLALSKGDKLIKIKEQLAKANCSAPEELENGLSTALPEY
ncbi:hypothetical protein M2E15_4494 [Bacillus mycoides]|nr:hypothetical protein M2E15_4494 [Bacillus mycoides]